MIVDVAFALIGVLLLAIGLVDLRFFVEDNSCTMSYMWPNYYRIPLRSIAAKSAQFGRYALYSYREAQPAEVDTKVRRIFSLFCFECYSFSL